jgi:hypothetical protein
MSKNQTQNADENWVTMYASKRPSDAVEKRRRQEACVLPFRAA